VREGFRDAGVTRGAAKVVFVFQRDGAEPEDLGFWIGLR
jgi:hypothetical protein